MTTASTLAQLASFATTSRSSRALAACVSSDFVNAKTSSFWKVTAASQRAATGAGAGEGGGGGATSRRAGGGAGRDTGAGWGCGAGSGAVAQDASRQRTELPIASFRFFKGPSSSLTRRALVVRATSSTPGIIHHMGERQRILRGKVARPRARIGWFERS